MYLLAYLALGLLVFTLLLLGDLLLPRCGRLVAPVVGAGHLALLLLFLEAIR